MKWPLIAGLLAGFVSAGVFVALRSARDDGQAGAVPQGTLSEKTNDGFKDPSSVEANARSPVAPATTSMPEEGGRLQDPESVQSEEELHDAYPSLNEETPEHWQEYYKDLPAWVLSSEREKVTALIVSASQDELRRLYDQGQGEYVGADGKVDLDDVFDENEITSVFFEPGLSGAYRVVLPRSQHQDLYTLKEKEVWLKNEIKRRGNGK